MSPFEIEVILHYHYSSGDFKNMNCNAFEIAIEKLIDKGLIIYQSDSKTKYFPNAAAIQAYVDAICAIPLPVQKWIVPEK